MAEQEPSKLKTGVRFSSPALGHIWPERSCLPEAFDDLRRVMRETDPLEFRALLVDDEVTFLVGRCHSYDLASEQSVWRWTWDESGPPDMRAARAA